MTTPSGLETSLPPASAEDVGMCSKRLDRLTRAMQRYIDDQLLAGTVTLVARKGKIVHFEALGHRYREEDAPMTKDALFNIMSMTKPIVSTALMMLYEEGRFILDEPITTFIPEIAGKQVVVRDDSGNRARVDALRPITFRHVLTHTAGMDPPYEALTEEERSVEKGETVEEHYINRAKWPLAFQPGDHWHYGTCTDYVALLVERITGVCLDDFLRERILKPLGMHDTHYNIPESKVGRIAAVYKPSGADNRIELHRAPAFREPHRYFSGISGLYSTAADYALFYQMILNGGELNGVRLLSPKTVQLMITNHTGDKSIYAHSPGYGFGLGFGILKDPAEAIEPLTPGSFTWGGAWGTLPWADPVEEVIGILMTQIAPFHHVTVRPVATICTTQAIIDSNSSKPFSIMGYEKLP